MSISQPSSPRDVTKDVLMFLETQILFTQSCKFQQGEEFVNELDESIADEEEHYDELEDIFVQESCEKQLRFGPLIWT